MTIVQRLGGSSALLISGVVIIRVLPAALLFPFAGVVADRYPLPSLALMSAYTLYIHTGTGWVSDFSLR